MPTIFKLTEISPVYFALILSVLAPAANAQPWQSVDATSVGWSEEGLKAAHDEAMAGRKPTAIMVVQDGKVIASWGDTNRKVDVASVRKSLLSALYGIAVSKGRVRLESTLSELVINDKPPSLTATEKQATVRDLLMSRSGIYHAAAHETGEMRRNRPERGSHAPGTFWWYNNWDFNALGTIYRQQTGEDIFKSFYQRIALPIGMEDFSQADGRYSLQKSSVHPAYPFKMSARDLARIGQLYLDGGRWNDKQIISAAWVKESTTPYSHTDRGNMGYGYLWWTLNPDVFGSGAAVASGYGGQQIAIIPSKGLVVVQTLDAGRKRTSQFVDFLRQLVAAAP